MEEAKKKKHRVRLARSTVNHRQRKEKYPRTTVCANVRKRQSSIKAPPIGCIHTPFRAAAGTPIQSSVASGVEGTIEVFPEFVQGLRDIEGFDRLWVMYHFHRAVARRLTVQGPALPRIRSSTAFLPHVHRLGRTGSACRRFVFWASMETVFELLTLTCWMERRSLILSPTCRRLIISRSFGSDGTRTPRTAGAVADDRFESKEPRR